MTTQTEALKMALEALELNNREWKATADSGDSGYWLAEEQDFYQQTEKAITAIKEALAQPEQRQCNVNPLTDEDKQHAFIKWGFIPANKSWDIQDWFYAGIAFAEAAHGITKE